MLRKIAIILVVVALSVVCYVPMAKAAAGLDYLISFVSTTEDTANAGLGGKPTWYQWLYKVEVVAGTKRNGLSHFTIDMETCYDAALLGVVKPTAGANGIAPNPSNLSGLTGNEYRSYNIVTGTDGSTGLYGIKWEPGASFEDIGDYDYFWFSAPTNQGVLNTLLVKHGSNQTTAQLLTPDCPECEDPVIPEPATMFLLGSGLVGVLLKRRRKV